MHEGTTTANISCRFQRFSSPLPQAYNKESCYLFENQVIFYPYHQVSDGISYLSSVGGDRSVIRGKGLKIEVGQPKLTNPLD